MSSRETKKTHSSSLKDLSDDDIQQLITDLSARDRYEMMALFLYEQLRLKIAEEGIGTTTNREKFYH